MKNNNFFDICLLLAGLGYGISQGFSVEKAQQKGTPLDSNLGVSRGYQDFIRHEEEQIMGFDRDKQKKAAEEAEKKGPYTK